MGRRRKQRPFPPWKTAAPGGYEKAFVQIGLSLLEHSKTLALNPAAFRLYVYMLLQAGGEKEFEYPRSKYERFISRRGFQIACDELVNEGFIEVAQDWHHIRKATVYRLSDKWKQP